MSDEETDEENSAGHPKSLAVRTIPWRAELLSSLISIIDSCIDHKNDHRRRFPGLPTDRLPSSRIAARFLKL